MFTEYWPVMADGVCAGMNEISGTDFEMLRDNNKKKINSLNSLNFVERRNLLSKKCSVQPAKYYATFHLSYGGS